MFVSKGNRVEIDVTQVGQASVARRRLIGAGLGGAVLSFLPLLSGKAQATTTTPTTAPATSTTAVPRRPSAEDVVLLAFAQTVELAAMSLYDQALVAVDLDDTQRPVIQALREAHKAYGQSLSALLGRNAPNAPSQAVVDLLSAGFTGSATELLGTASMLESTAVATHQELIRQLQGIDGAALLASIMIVEARHGTALAVLAGKSDIDELLVAFDEKPLPVEG